MRVNEREGRRKIQREKVEEVAATTIRGSEVKVSFGWMDIG